MDERTLAAYDAGAQAFARDWHGQPPASELQAIAKRFFKRGLTADVGCGSGRDVAWLAAQGFPAVGFDPSAGLLTEARRRYPHLDFTEAALPELTGVADARFNNVLCETVIMHLAEDAVASSVRRLITLLKSDGVLYLSWRISPSSQRDDHGRLYAAIDKAVVLGALQGTSILLEEDVVSASSGKRLQRIVARKTGDSSSRQST